MRSFIPLFSEGKLESSVPWFIIMVLLCLPYLLLRIQQIKLFIMFTAWIDLFPGWTRADWLPAKSHFQLADVLESTRQLVGATQMTVRTGIQLWGKETVSAGSQMWSWARAAFLCLLVITAELCHGRDFISSWYFCMKKSVGVWTF